MYYKLISKRQGLYKSYWHLPRGILIPCKVRFRNTENTGSLIFLGSDTFYIANIATITACVLSFVYVITEKLYYNKLHIYVLERNQN